MQRLVAASQRPSLTFKGNLAATRYGWLRLTPAFSLHAVLDRLPRPGDSGVRVLDPFSGTGTTALVCAEQGIACDGVDINPFLVWLAGVKTRAYSEDEILAYRRAAGAVYASLRAKPADTIWLPRIHQLEKWWDSPTLTALGGALAEVKRLVVGYSVNVEDLLLVAFCRVMIETAHVSFGHQSMSFRKPGESRQSRPFFSPSESVAERWRLASASVADAASSTMFSRPRFYLGDARTLSRLLPERGYSAVVTSPPYPNRMSYIRELRPYMYWLGFLDSGEAAGELDWAAIGGTWGSATSRLTKWLPEPGGLPAIAGFGMVVDGIRERSPLLANYVQRYFVDMAQHIRELFEVVAPGGTVTYIVGNSKFYDVLLPSEAYFAQLFSLAGFERVEVQPLRKRTSKRELFEFAVSCRKPRR